MRRRLAANGVKVLEVEMVPLSAATRVADYRPMLETGAAIGASRLTVVGDSADFAAVADKLAEMAELALPYGIAVDLEFMPFRPVQSLAHAVDVVTRADHPNAHILIDALHVFRSGRSPQEFAAPRSRAARPAPALRCARAGAAARRADRRGAHAPPAAGRRASLHCRR